jgi:hypothetical protein
MMPIAEEQSKLVGQYLTGRYALPPVEMLNAERVEMFERVRSRYVSSPRHTIQINCGEYTMDLRREVARGYRRAESQQFSLPIQPRVIRPPAKAVADT